MRNIKFRHFHYTIHRIEAVSYTHLILKKDEMPEYERFIPKKEFIKNDNRFSPPGVEWLYLALGNESDIHLSLIHIYQPDQPLL